MNDCQVLSFSTRNFHSIDEKRRIETRPIKGTRPRGKNPAEDARFRRELLESPKEAAELNMITDLLRNDIESFKDRIGKVLEHRTVEATPFGMAIHLR